MDLETQVQVKEAQLEMFSKLENREELTWANAELKRYYLFVEDFWRQKAGDEMV